MITATLVRPDNLARASDHLAAASRLLARAHEAGGRRDQSQAVGLAEYHAEQALGLLAHWVES